MVADHPILVVDDEPYVRDLLVDALAEAGYATDAAPDGSAALECVRRNHYHVMLIDITIPDTGGLEILDRIRAIDELTQFIIVTTQKNREVRRETGSRGVAEYLTKPFLIPALLASVKRVCAQYEASAGGSVVALPTEASPPSGGDPFLQTANPHHLLEHLSCALLLLDHRGLVRFLNPAAEALLGQPAQTLQGRACAEILRVPTGDHPLTPWLEGADSALELLVDLKVEDESPRAVLLRGARIPPQAEDKGGVALILEARDDLRACKNHQEVSEHCVAIVDLIQGIVHRVRNPITGIQTAAEMITRHMAPGEKDHRYATVIVDEAQRIEALLVDLLAYVQPGLNALEEVELGSILERASDKVQKAATARGAEIALDAPEELPRLRADGARLERAFQALLSNAINAVEPNQGFIEVAACLLPDRATVRVEVVDNGRGVDSADVQRRGDSLETAPEWRGGMGLAIATRVVEDHGGTLELHGKRGLGSVATVELPLCAREVCRGQRPVMVCTTKGNS